MDKVKYLQRINFSERAGVDKRTLDSLHRHHVIAVPFENLDIHYRRPFDLAPENIYKKVVENFRGGFCYELNFLFNELLRTIGFSTNIIAARVYDQAGELGPEFDHMSVHVRLNGDFLADVGFGDLFLQPLEVKEGVQSDGRNFFLIEPNGRGDYTLSMATNGSDFQKKYNFNLTEVSQEPFNAPCIDKQTNPNSYFVKNTICTKATETGRITVFNDRLITKNGEERAETRILSDIDLRVQLRRHFGIEIG